MAAFPTPFGGQAALYPLTIVKRHPVAVMRFDDASEQRFRQAAGLSAFQLELDQITKAEKDAIVTFFSDSKGSFDATWSITLAATTYDYMAFADDAIAPIERVNGVWSLSLKIRQTRKN